MAAMDWFKVLDFPGAMGNVAAEFPGDWYRDPWGWPEIPFLLGKGQPILIDHCNSTDTAGRQVSSIDVPKENWGSRPAVVLDPVERITYQALVDKVSSDLIGSLSPNSYGWRLPAVAFVNGSYSHNNIQWDNYRAHLSRLAGKFDVALKTDIVSFFASIPNDIINDEIEARAPSNNVTKRLLRMLDSFQNIPNRSGLPQRSTASAVIANMVMIPMDDVLTHHARKLARNPGDKIAYSSFARWMDDMWLFGKDSGQMRSAQIELQRTARSLGLNLNSAKTELLEGEDVVREAREIEHSAVDFALIINDETPLEELIDKVLLAQDNVNRTTAKFALRRLALNSNKYRSEDLLALAQRAPHIADVLAGYYQKTFRLGALQDWFLSYVKGNWSAFDWSIASYGHMFPTERSPRKAIRDYFAGKIESRNCSLPLLAVACQKLASWDQENARAVIRSAMSSAENPLERRVLTLGALEAGEQRAIIKRWLGVHAENRATLEMLKDRNFVAPKIKAGYGE